MIDYRALMLIPLVYGLLICCLMILIVMTDETIVRIEKRLTNGLSHDT